MSINKISLTGVEYGITPPHIEPDVVVFSAEANADGTGVVMQICLEQEGAYAPQLVHETTPIAQAEHPLQVGFTLMARLWQAQAAWRQDMANDSFRDDDDDNGGAFVPV